MERRRFFRIDDRMELYCERLSEDQAQDAKAILEPTDAQAMLASFDRQIQTIIESARVQAPAVASLAEMLNRKMNFIISALDIGSEWLQRVSFKTHHVNLSACGISFSSDTPYREGEKLRVELRLQPNDLNLVILARVISCDALPEPTPELGYRLRLNWDGMGAEGQELLIQHIVRRQSQMLQAERSLREV